MNEEQTTPRPWATYDRGIGWEVVRADGQSVNQGFRDTFTKGDAALIVQAVNAHDALVGICTGMLECLDAGDPWPVASRRSAAEALRAALEATRPHPPRTDA